MSKSKQDLAGKVSIEQNEVKELWKQIETLGKNSSPIARQCHESISALLREADERRQAASSKASALKPIYELIGHGTSSVETVKGYQKLKNTLKLIAGDTKLTAEEIVQAKEYIKEQKTALGIDEKEDADVAAKENEVEASSSKAVKAAAAPVKAAAAPVTEDDQAATVAEEANKPTDTGPVDLQAADTAAEAMDPIAPQATAPTAGDDQGTAPVAPQAVDPAVEAPKAATIAEEADKPADTGTVDLTTAPTAAVEEDETATAPVEEATQAAAPTVGDDQAAAAGVEAPKAAAPAFEGEDGDQSDDKSDNASAKGSDQSDDDTSEHPSSEGDDQEEGPVQSELVTLETELQSVEKELEALIKKQGELSDELFQLGEEALEIQDEIEDKNTQIATCEEFLNKRINKHTAMTFKPDMAARDARTQKKDALTEEVKGLSLRVENLEDNQREKENDLNKVEERIKELLNKSNELQSNIDNLLGEHNTAFENLKAAFKTYVDTMQEAAKSFDTATEIRFDDLKKGIAPLSKEALKIQANTPKEIDNEYRKQFKSNEADHDGISFIRTPAIEMLSNSSKLLRDTSINGLVKNVLAILQNAKTVDHTMESIREVEAQQDQALQDAGQSLKEEFTKDAVEKAMGTQQDKIKQPMSTATAAKVSALQPIIADKFTHAVEGQSSILSKAHGLWEAFKGAFKTLATQYYDIAGSAAKTLQEFIDTHREAADKIVKFDLDGNLELGESYQDVRELITTHTDLLDGLVAPETIEAWKEEVVNHGAVLGEIVENYYQ